MPYRVLFSVLSAVLVCINTPVLSAQVLTSTGFISAPDLPPLSRLELAGIQRQGSRLFGYGRVMIGDTTTNGNSTQWLPKRMQSYVGYSDDEGKTWRTLKVYDTLTVPPPHTGFSALTVVSDSILYGYAATNAPSRFFSDVTSTDGGRTWQDFSSRIPALPANRRPGYSYRFANERRGLATSSADTLTYTTTDAGATWQRSRVPYRTDRFFQDITVMEWVDTTVIFCAYSRAGSTPPQFAQQFFRSADAGRTWAALGCTVEGYAGDSSNAVSFTQMRFISPSYGIAWGRIFKEGDSIQRHTIFLTRNGGTSWRIAYTFEERTDIIRDIHTFGQDSLTCVTTTGKILTSINGGATWSFSQSQRLTQEVLRDTGAAVQSVLIIGSVFNSIHDGYAVCFIPDASVFPFRPSVFPLPQAVRIQFQRDTTSNVNEGSTMPIYTVVSQPQPASSDVTIHLRGLSNGESPTITIIDMLGNTVRTSETAGYTITGSGDHSYTFSVSDLPSGMYMANIRCGSLHTAVPVAVAR